MRDIIDVYNKCDDSEYRQKKDEVIEKTLKLIENSGINFCGQCNCSTGKHGVPPAQCL